jgi:hypothetical protein
MLNTIFHDGFVANWISCRHEHLGNEIVFVPTSLRLIKSIILSPLLQLSRAKRRRRAFPAAISLAPFLFGGQRGFGEGNGPGNRRAVVYRVGGSLPRSRVCSPSTDGEARVR